MDFWTINCGPCEAAIPSLRSAYATYRNKGLEILGIDGGEKDTADVLRPFLAKQGLTWPETIQERPDGPIHERYRYGAWPIYFLIGRDGSILLVRRDGDHSFLANLASFMRP